MQTVTEKQCRKCKKPIDKGATVCPHCRSKQPPPVWIVVVAVVILAGLVGWGWQSCASLTEKAESHREPYTNKFRAWGMARTFVETRLVSPGSADYGWQTSSECVTDLGQGVYVVKGWVDAQNRFGAKVRSYFTCRVKYVGKEEWVCQSLDINQR